MRWRRRRRQGSAIRPARADTPVPRSLPGRRRVAAGPGRANRLREPHRPSQEVPSPARRRTESLVLPRRGAGTRDAHEPEIGAVDFPSGQVGGRQTLEVLPLEGLAAQEGAPVAVITSPHRMSRPRCYSCSSRGLAPPGVLGSKSGSKAGRSPPWGPHRWGQGVDPLGEISFTGRSRQPGLAERQPTQVGSSGAPVPCGVSK